MYYSGTWALSVTVKHPTGDAELADVPPGLPRQFPGSCAGAAERAAADARGRHRLVAV